MKKLQFLKTLGSLIWVSSIIGMIAIVVYIVYVLANGPAGVPLKVSGQNFDITDNINKALAIFGVAAYVIFIVGIYEFRKLLDLFAQRVIFEDANIFLLHRIGERFLFSSAIAGFPLLAYNVFYKNNISIELGGGPLLFAACLGLFFMVLREVFAMAQTMKNENDLTV